MSTTVSPAMGVTQRRVLEFIRAYAKTNGFAPSVREIGAAVGLVSPSSVAHHVRELQRMGWIRKAPGVARAIVVLDPATGGD